MTTSMSVSDHAIALCGELSHDDSESVFLFAGAGGFDSDVAGRYVTTMSRYGDRPKAPG